MQLSQDIVSILSQLDKNGWCLNGVLFVLTLKVMKKIFSFCYVTTFSSSSPPPPLYTPAKQATKTKT